MFRDHKGRKSFIFVAKNVLLTLHLKVKGHLLCVILVGNEGSVQAPLFCPHSDQREDRDIPGDKYCQRFSLLFLQEQINSGRKFQVPSLENTLSIATEESPHSVCIFLCLTEGKGATIGFK